MKINKHVLIVEESRVIQLFMKELIKKQGYDVTAATTLVQIKELTAADHFDIAVIAMDLLENVEAIVDHTIKEGIPVILLKGLEEEKIRKQLVTKNIVDYVDKRHKEDFQEIAQLISRIEKNNRQKILVVDDSKTYRSYIVSLLKTHRFDTFEAEEGREAMQLLAKHPDIKLIITDYEMPAMNGLELIKEVRKQFNAHLLPMIVISSLDAKSVIVECLRSGANDYLHKPFEREEFFSRIYKTLSYKENLDEIREQTRLLEHYKETIDKNTIVSMTDESGFITYISEAFEKVSGYSKQEVIGRNHGVFRHSDTPNTFYSDMWRTLNFGKSWDGEVKNRRKDGSTYWLRLHIEPEKDNEGNLTGYSAVGHDITNKIHLEALTKELEYRVAAEIERNRLQTAQMVEQSRLAQMGEMISMIAHQWRQPLASISAISSTLTLDVMMDAYKKEFFEERLEAISDLAQHLSSTIDDFRGFFKVNKERGEATWKMIAEGSLSIIEPTLQTYGITVERAYDSNEVCSTYVNEVRQVLLNIFKNAEDVFLEKKGENGMIWVRSFQKEEMMCLSIEDNGGGIPKEVLGKIFDPYFSTKEKKDGTGLGLYMSKTIIEEHCKGKLTVRNTKKGACFEISLPVKETP